VTGVWSIPATWVWTTFGDIADVIGGGTPRTADPTNWDGGNIPWVTPADLSGYREKYITHGARFVTPAGLEGSSARIVPAGTVLMSSRAPVGYAAIAGQPLATNQGFKSFALRGELLPDYFYYFLLGNKELIREFASGTTFIEVSGKNAARIPVPVPPLAEQRRIVTTIEEHLSRLDAAVAALDRIRSGLPRYRAAVLKAACEGRLLDEDGARGPRHKTDDSRHGWISTTVGAISNVGTGSTPLTSNREFYDRGRVPWVTSGALNAPFVRKPSGLVTEKAVTAHRLRLFPPHTLLVAMYGETRGKSAELLIPATINQAIAAIQLTKETAQYRPFVRLCLLHEYVRLRKAARGGAQPNLNLSLIRGIRLHLPPMAEQDRIVAEVDRCLSLADAAERTVTAGLAKAKRLRQAILKRAFEGKLVPQDPNDELASVLLQRIKSSGA
jgi:type I restriction enzyme S subunit